MKIAILGSAPSSLSLAPFGDETWKIWGCSPGVYPFCPRADAWFELHRWEPGVVGKPETQKPWFSPEYVLWMAQREPNRCPVWMAEPTPAEIASRIESACVMSVRVEVAATPDKAASVFALP